MSRTGSMRSTQKIVLSLLIVCFLVLGLLVAVLLVRQQQDVRSGAADLNTLTLVDSQGRRVQTNTYFDKVNKLVVSGTVTRGSYVQDGKTYIDVVTIDANSHPVTVRLYYQDLSGLFVVLRSQNSVIPNEQVWVVDSLNTMSTVVGKAVILHIDMGSQQPIVNGGVYGPIVRTII